MNATFDTMMKCMGFTRIDCTECVFYFSRTEREKEIHHCEVLDASMDDTVPCECFKLKEDCTKSNYYDGCISSEE